MTIRPALRVFTDATSLEALPDIAQEAENRQFSGLYAPSSGTTYKEFCRAGLEATGSIIVSTSIVPIYRQPAVELASFAAELHDLSGGGFRFRLGLGFSHAGILTAAGIDVGNPLSDMRAYIGDMHEVADKNGLTLPPIYLATLRNRMLKLADKIADGADGLRQYCQPFVVIKAYL
jgi:alkanesulfonate monooxygenase SsuD/methylene tetrahydromethanopterin reductase-like flavin-dependent oxidoreductase (luciferase family)